MSVEATAAVVFEGASAPAPAAAFLIFPPFPHQQPGAPAFIPFRDFTPNGVVTDVFDGDDEAEELDALGIPTVELRAKHNLTEAEQSRRRKKRKTLPATITVNGQTRSRLWYEEWEDNEQFRKSIVNPAASRVDRFHQAAQEFRTSRTWPLNSAGVFNLWDAFRLYVGIISSIQPPPSKKRFPQEQTTQPDEADDDEDDDEGMVLKKPAVVVLDPEAASEKRREEEEAANAERRKDLSEEAKAKIVKRHELKEARMDFFLNDPEMALMIFFSAHYRDRGLMWEKVRCRDGPILIQFFLEFMLRSRVIPESEKQLKKALEVVKKARTELPLTFTLSGLLPDSINSRFQDLFGSMTQKPIILPEDPENDARYEEAKRRIEEEQRQQEEEAEEAKKKRFAEFVASGSGGGNLQTIDPDDPSLVPSLEMAKETVKDNADLNGMDVDAGGGGWGNTSSEFTANAEPTTGMGWGWGADNGGWGNDSGAQVWGDPDAAHDAWGDEGTKVRQSLIELMGPTVLPFTHTTGVIETSTRKIVEVVPPPDPAQPKKKVKKGRSAQEVVEEDLEQRFGYIVLAPWTKIGNHINSDIGQPEILEDSRGAVVDAQDNVSAGKSSNASPHDPKKDCIQVLLSSETIEKAKECIGMGMCATWVQLARRDHAAEAKMESEGIPNPKLGGPGVNGEATKWWYMEHHIATFPSFHADRYYEGQD